MVTDNFYRQGNNIVGPCNTTGPSAGDSYITDCRQEALDVESGNGCFCTHRGCQGSPPGKGEICNNANQVDLAGAILEHIYGPLNDRERLAPPDLEGPALDAQLGQYVQAFDQTAIFPLFASSPETTLVSSSMAEKGYIYIPEACKNGTEECRLHIALHGCKQGGNTGGQAGGGYSGNLYSKYAGYNEWAKNNNIVVVYPQVQPFNGIPVYNEPVNPQGCWDWWGQYYTHDKYHTKAGLQIKAIAQIINVLVNDNSFLEVPVN